jgi:hypothetical protein
MKTKISISPLTKVFFILLVMCCFTSCKYFYGEKKVVKVTKVGEIITYDFNYGNQIFTFGNDTILPVGSWEDDKGMWHLPK